MSKFQPFEMERAMSAHEQNVEFNLSESGVLPLSLRELLGDDPVATERLLAADLGYPHVNGSPALRENIAAMYDGATADNVLVTTGAIEANYNTVRTLTSAGDEIVVMLPNYMQIWGIAKNERLAIKTFHLREADGWAPDLAQLAELVSENTKLIAVCNPNNPTGYVLTESEMDAVVAAADSVGAWIMADEVYAGAERVTDRQTPSFYGRYEKVLAVGSLSKAYGLPGLRIGWVVGPVGTIDDVWARHEYTTLSATALSNHLASIALSSEVRPLLIERTRKIIREGFLTLEDWLDAHKDTFDLVPPSAAAIAFVRYRLDTGSTEFAETLRRQKSVLVVPGDHFGMDKYVRISFGLPREYLTTALERVHDVVVELAG